MNVTKINIHLGRFEVPLAKFELTSSLQEQAPSLSESRSLRSRPCLQEAALWNSPSGPCDVGETDLDAHSWLDTLAVGSRCDCTVPTRLPDDRGEVAVTVLLRGFGDGECLAPPDQVLQVIVAMLGGRE